MDYAIETENLQKHFKNTKAVDGISLAMPRGQVFGLLGPNGAGKTTIVRLLATLLKPSAGRAKVLGLDLQRNAASIRSKVSLTGQFASVDEDLTGRENLILLARLLGHSWSGARTRTKELLQAFDLMDAARRQVTTYSGGMRRRLDIAASLIVTPEILFLDEPTTGLDPASRNQVWGIVRDIAATGTTVVLTTQYLEEADQLADCLTVIDHGRCIAQGTSRELKASVGSGTLKIQLQQPAQRAQALALLESIAGNTPVATAQGLTVQVEDAAAATGALTLLAEQNIIVAEFALGSPSLDEVFFALTGKPATTEPGETPA